MTATGQVTSPSAESAESSNGLKFGNGSNAGVFFPDPSSATAYEDSNSQQTMLPMNLALRAGYLLPLGLPSGAIDYSVSTNRSISGPLDQRKYLNQTCHIHRLFADSLGQATKSTLPQNSTQGR